MVGSVMTSDASAGGASNVMRNVAAVPSIAETSPPFTVLGATRVYAGGRKPTSNDLIASGYRTSIVNAGLAAGPAATRYVNGSRTFSKVTTRGTLAPFSRT